MDVKGLIYQIKRPLRRWLYEGLDRLLLLQKASGDERDILVIKLDVLGDYLVFRPFLKPLKEQAMAQGGKLVLAANSAVASLARELDSETVDEFIFLEARGKFLSSPGYHWRVIRQFRRHFAVVYHPTAKRIYECESLIRLAEAPVKFGVEWQDRFSRPDAERRADRWYTRLISVPSFGMFEFDRLNVFFAEAAGIRLLPSSLKIVVREDNLPVALQKPYAVLFPGAGFAIREWPLDRFTEVARHLARQYNLNVYVAGSRADVLKGDAIAREGYAANLCGQIHMRDLPRLVAEARLVVANESGPVHLAAGIGTPVVCISNGNHFGWWNPYPTSYQFIVATVYPDEIEKNLDKPEMLYKLYGSASTLSMGLIETQRVLKAIDLQLDKAES